MKHFDTFAGAGGFSLALKQSNTGFETIGYSEIDKFAIQTYENNFPGIKNYGDISEIDIPNLPKFDLLTGGFPCQDVSVAGKQSLDGGRTVLVEYLLQILEQKQPKYFVFENVKGLLNKKFTDFRESIFDRIEQSGYGFTYKVLNTKDFGLPQNRERVFIVGELGRETGHFQFPKGQKLVNMQDFLEPSDEIGVGDFMQSVRKNVLSQHVEIIKSKKDIHQLKCSSGWQDNKVGIAFSPTLRANKCFCLVKQNNLIKELNRTEYEKFQGFPKGWTNCVSQAQGKKQMGNAISIPVVESIFAKLFLNLNE